ncbi:MAG: hypothetical protein HYW89_00385 [Candidatus Sungiibacteriota bacterium]|uniref:Uncharacterized protein n=1 Tax=Candidatus Sungiibacteriota bacterium TaxID=2750080 RepID=A0A7T5RJQ9_9BACT|nr:MAG: hypothetical protein HYW89_00385 [Candidatus Sungbacteria bacterium]
MNKANNLTKISIVVGLLGVLSLVLAWIAEARGFAFGYTSDHWFNDAIVLVLIAIWLKLGAIYHKGGGTAF